MDYIAAAEIRWRIHLKKLSHGEWHGRCPLTPGCAEKDGFIVWEDRGNYLCRKCGKKGFVDEKENLTPAQQEARKLELRIAALERARVEHDRRLTALEQMHAAAPQADAYHRNLEVVPGAREWWTAQGIRPDTQDLYNLGYCGQCPTAEEGRDSFTIPIYYRGKLWNIRHRLVDAPNGDKYRPHLPGLGAVVFNADLLDRQPDSIIIAEGEKKAIVASQWGFPAVGIPGATAWKDKWAALFAHVLTVYVCMDPDATAPAAAIVRQIGPRARLVSLPVKLDDFFTVYNGTPDDLWALLQNARPLCAGRN